MYRNPWEIDWNDPQQAQQASQRPLIQRPRDMTPPPQTAPQAQGDVLRNTRTQQEITYGPAQEQRARDQAARETAQQAFQRQTELRREFNQRPDVLRYQEVVPLYISARDSANTRAGNLNLIYAFAKIMDPGSAVREGEQVLVQGTGAVQDRVQNLISQLDRSGQLTEDTRRNLLAELRSRRHEMAQSYNRERARYSGLAQRFSFDPADVIGEHPAAQYAAEERRRAADAGNVHVELDWIDPDHPDAPAPQQLPPGFNEWRESLESALEGRRVHNSDELIALARRLNPQFASTIDNREMRTQIDRAIGTLARNPRNRVDLFTAAPRARPSHVLDAQEQMNARNRIEGEPGAGDLRFHGQTLGLSDEAAGVGNVLYNTVTSPFTDDPFNPLRAYTAGRDAELMRLDRARDNTGLFGRGAELLGNLASGRPGPGLLSGPAPGLGGRMLQGGRIGAQQGALAGAGYAESPPGQVDLMAAPRGAGAGAVVGGAIGLGLPLLTAGARGAYGIARNAVRGDPAATARRTIADAIAADANTPRGVGREMQEAQGLGVPYMVADSGDNVRGLLAASSRSPGPARTLARDALEQRQEGLADRVSGAIERDLGPTTNPHQVRDDLIAQAQTAAAPLYERAYANPGADTFAQRIGALMRRPAMRQAMARAQRIAEEEGRDPTTLGFDVNAAGETTVTRTPSWQTFDYIKRGIDDVLNAQPRNPNTGRLILDEGTRAIDQTRRAFLAQIDRANPDYAAARQAWAGPTQAREAMDLGLRALNMSADDLAARTRDLTAGEMDMFRLGVRRAMSEAIQRRGDSADTVSALIGTPRRRAMLSRLFGGRAEFDRFVRTLHLEREGNRTFRSATQGSPTAQNLQNDRGLEQAAPIMLDMTVGGGAPIATGISSGVRMLSRARAATAGSEARQQIAAVLSETDPSRLAELGRELVREAARRRAAQSAARRRNVGTAMTTGSGGGGLAGQNVPPLFPVLFGNPTNPR